MKIFPIYFLLLTALVTGCAKSELLHYTEESNVFFSYTRFSTNYDTIMINFAFQGNRTEDSAGFYVNLLGKVTPDNRLFNMTADQSSTAVADKHYRLPVNDSLFIPANANQKLVPVKILRPADLREKTVSLFLKLSPNNNFQTNMSVFNAAATDVISATNLEIIIQDILPKPDLWDNNTSALGAYSRKKLELLVANQSLLLAKFYTGTLYSTTQLTNYSRQFQTYLNNQKNAGKTITEEDGTEMKMGSAVQ
ncbi:DUF4843 domain-containing protein [Chitinophaga ginsengisegetis]|uniref:DUF4843 domain-containing protein n=1 Tax=Chitinophaga ginsengisegetis TaxID=393003 RepID=UPI000DB97F1F|nr:DUF4843 domain-containing protein [Chitinophaga ginsengisegetis]MDR6566891.1 hypothetical protein [Chitinophaga ginsengisegetis]MDR6646621.1 hypothetical protein [Chitinophaga ginsengisegetis]MDR6652971.1 hypothetical protein [Chitinophaga ginsengisegetis]